MAGGLLTAAATVVTVRWTLNGQWFGDQVFNGIPLEAAATALGAAIHYHRAFAAGAREQAERIAEARSDQARLRRPRSGWRSPANCTTCSATPWR